MALRYFVSHGPATLDDFVGWAFLTKADARAGLAEVEERLETFELDGVRFWRGEPRPAIGGVHLLAGFDEYVLGYKACALHRGGDGGAVTGRDRGTPSTGMPAASRASRPVNGPGSPRRVPCPSLAKRATDRSSGAIANRGQ